MARKLKTEVDTEEMGERVSLAFEAAKDRTDGRPVYEHGQWWITCDDGAQFSVVDAEGGRSVDGFDFEQVTEAEA